ncbi:acyl-ACP--UDP-N-acetylglucosamine O-acyltransferase [Thermogutta sp.]|uniref:acyl-ACP--UDP-N-acetylglucosamine O-acyltransferase n=1 Tax=Thermogutta sp. TaxID=1962930 RepID=UPI0032200B06
MATRIHPTAVISPLAAIGCDVEIGPFCVVEEDTQIGDGCRLEARVTIKKGTVLGDNNWICEGAVLGGIPQHVHIPERPGKVIIGSGNVIRENVTIHRALDEEDATLVGDNNLLMVNVHIAHDCRIGNNTIFANNVMLAGHVTVGDRAYVSGAVAVHQFCRIGSFAMVGGQAHINKDVPPYVTVDGLSSYVVGLNQIGLRRAGFSTEAIEELKRAYRVIYRSGLLWNDVLEQLRINFSSGPAALFYQFLATTTRGIIPERRTPTGATLKLHKADDQADEDDGYRRVRVTG